MLACGHGSRDRLRHRCRTRLSSRFNRLVVKQFHVTNLAIKFLDNTFDVINNILDYGLQQPDDQVTEVTGLGGGQGTKSVRSVAGSL